LKTSLLDEENSNQYITLDKASSKRNYENVFREMQIKVAIPAQENK